MTQRENLHSKYHLLGSIASFAAFVLGLAYAVTTFLGFLSLESPQDPIGDPFFTAMEILILLLAPAMAVSMIAVHYYALPEDRIWSLAALLCMFIMVGITSSVHFMVLTVSHTVEAAQVAGSSYFLSFKWPSVIYALDVLAWDWFFALSMFFAAPVFKTGRQEKMLRMLMLICGLLSLAGLLGVPTGNMQIRNIGIIGYGLIAPVVFLWIGIILRRR